MTMIGDELRFIRIRDSNVVYVEGIRYRTVDDADEYGTEPDFLSTCSKCALKKHCDAYGGNYDIPCDGCDRSDGRNVHYEEDIIYVGNKRV